MGPSLHNSHQCTIYIERIQKFSLRMSYKAWDEEYDNLLSRANLQTLAKRRKFLKVCYLYQIMNGTSNFPNAPIERRNMDPRLRNSESKQLCQLFARTNAYHHSFFPHTISIYGTVCQHPFTDAHPYLFLSVML